VNLLSQYDVLVVDDSVFMRKIITDLINEDPQFRVVDTAKNGVEAVEKVRLLKPHVVTMDVEMPVMNGLAALKSIMKYTPTPVIMLSSLTEDGAIETIKALELGALDFVRKPSGTISLDLYKVKDALMDKLRVAVRTSVVKMTAAIPIPAPPPLAPVPKEWNPSDKTSRINQIIAIGTSTGGPRALHQVVSQLPGDLDAPVVIVQHMPPNFTKSLAQRLDSVSQLKVVEAEDGMKLQNGAAYIAPGGFHMVVVRDGSSGYNIRLSKEDPVSGHRPSVDKLFASLVSLKELKRHIVIMTGMGSDGAKGMEALHKTGALTTIAESEETCIVYGMPRAAVELNCVSDLLPQYHIAGRLIQAVAAT
jgi:two-component system chemotaxis response regulator CheB